MHHKSSAILWALTLTSLTAAQVHSQMENKHAEVEAYLCNAGADCNPVNLRIWDGDTFIIDRKGFPPEKIRIENIDAPEIEGRCSFETSLAKAAKNQLADFLSGQRLVLQRSKIDRYGRQIAMVFVDGQNIGVQLIQNNLARSWNGKREPWC